MQRVVIVNEPEIKKTMKDADIQSVSIATGSTKDAIATKELQVPDKGTITSETIYGVASLSKPVFVRLALMLVGSNDFSLNDTKLEKIYPFADFCKENNFEWDAADKDNIRRVALFTPAMVLSHQTGLPITYREGSGPLKFDDFEPGQGYGYSGIHLMYLQKCIEVKFGMPLEALAKKYVFDPSGMTNSSFYPRYELGFISERGRKSGKIYLKAS